MAACFCSQSQRLIVAFDEAIPNEDIFVNQTLQQIQAILLAQHAAFSQLLDSTSDPTLARGIVMEMQELLHRINLTQSLLFTQSSDRLTEALPAIRQANAVLTTAIQQTSSLTTLINASSTFLRDVDKAIDNAKAMAADEGDPDTDAP
jgi:hypothetical protein